jgi:hypothetical protein
MKVLIYVHSPTWFTELSLLGRYLRATGHEPVFFIPDFQHWTMHHIAEQLAADGIPCILACDTPPPRMSWTDAHGLPPSGTARRFDQRLASGLRGWLYRTAPQIEREFRQELRELGNTVADARSLIRAQGADIVVMGGDNANYTTAALIEGSHAEGVPVVLVPSTMSNGLEEAEVYTSDPRYHLNQPPAHLAARLFPQWLYRHKGLPLLRCPPARLLALETLGIAPPQPWAFNSGFAEVITAESPAMIDYAAAAGLPRERMIATGSPSDDAMFTVLQNAPQERRRLYEELGLPHDRPMLLTPLPPDFLYVNGGRPQCDFQTYAQLAKAWLDPLAEQDTFNVVVALHPTVEIDKMRHLEQPNVRIAARKTLELVPLCDLYVASVSSTIRWAIGCGKPVINYDVYRYRYTDFMNIDAVLFTEEYDEYRGWIRKLAEQPGELELLRQKQVRNAPRWGFLDGRCSERILDVLTDAVQRRAA